MYWENIGVKTFIEFKERKLLSEIPYYWRKIKKKHIGVFQKKPLELSLKKLYKKNPRKSSEGMQEKNNQNLAN